MQYTTPEELLGPPRIDSVSMGISAGASFVSGALGGICILGCTFIFLSTTQSAAPAIFPYMLSLVAFITLVITQLLQWYFARMIFPAKYRSSASQSLHIFGFSLVAYLLFTPVYVFVGGGNTELLMAVFVTHVLTSALGSHIITEVVSQYRYSLLSIYSSFVGFFAAASLALMYFSGSSTSQKILFSLAAVLAITLFIQNLCKTLFEFCYFKLYELTGQDILGSALTEVATEEMQSVHQAEKTLTQF